MSNLNMDLGVLEHQMHQAHRNAVQAELSAAGLQEVGHPLLLCILRSAGEHPLSVFIYADPADRTRRIAARNGLDERRAMHRAQKIDRMRKHHFDFYADTLWGEPASYDLMLSSSEYGIIGAAEVIAAAARAGK